MLYFKHSELAEIYHVSLKTVHNWIDSAKQGRVALQLVHTESKRTYIADTAANIVVLKQLSERGKKFRNGLHTKTVEPKPEFYKIYNRRQILDIITNMDVYGEVPRQYNYFQDGATNWDGWLQRLAQEESANILKGTLELLRTNMEALDRLLGDAKRINVIDLGAGNALPVKELLGHLLEKQKLHRYIAIDISSSMLAVAERNIKDWYGDKVPFEGHIRDIAYEHFDDLLVDDMLDKEADQTLNLVLLLGGTPVNFRHFNDVFNAVHSSMGGNDLLVYTDKPDTEMSRRYFDFHSVPGVSKLSPNHKYLLDLMNIDESMYDVEMGFDQELRMRFIRIRMKVAITLKFSFEGAERVIFLEKGDNLLMLRVWHKTTLEIISEFEKAGLTLVQSSLTKDRQFLLTISGVETKLI